MKKRTLLFSFIIIISALFNLIGCKDSSSNKSVLGNRIAVVVGFIPDPFSKNIPSFYITTDGYLFWFDAKEKHTKKVIEKLDDGLLNGLNCIGKVDIDKLGVLLEEFKGCGFRVSDGKDDGRNLIIMRRNVNSGWDEYLIGNMASVKCVMLYNYLTNCIVEPNAYKEANRLTNKFFLNESDMLIVTKFDLRFNVIDLPDIPKRYFIYSNE